MADQPTEADVHLVAGAVHRAISGCEIEHVGRHGDEDEDIARAVLVALAEAGRMLPEGAEVEIIYGVRDVQDRVQVMGPGPVSLANARASLHPVFVEVMVQERRRWPDGTRLSTPWRTFEEGSDG
jgi:hypothetical protein